MKEVHLNINTRAYDFWRIALEEWTAIAFSMMNKELRVVFQFLEHSIIFCSNHWYYKRRKPRIERDPCAEVSPHVDICVPISSHYVYFFCVC